MTTPRDPSRRGFTLTELMISIALAIILILGVNAVFSSGGRTISAGQAISEVNRDAQALYDVFQTDIAAMATDTPALVIRSSREPAFLNAADAAADNDYNPASTSAQIDQQMRTVDLDGDGTDGEAGVFGEQISPAVYNNRNHRSDKLIFFQRGMFERKTGQTQYTEKLVSPMTSREAYIWYGHLKQPNYSQPLSDPPYYESRGPGIDRYKPQSPAPWDATENPENFYASQWVLGRVQILMAQPDTNGHILDADGDRQDFIARRALETNDRSAAPFTVNSLNNSDEEASDNDWRLQWSRYDLAGMTIDRYRGILTRFAANSANEHWAQALSSFWYQTDLNVKRPLTAQSIARSTPALAVGCSQFIVEFAGDFYEQVPATGAPAATVPPRSDGILDYVVSANNGARSIRWYGMPRDTSGPDGVPDGIIHAQHDVVPVKLLPATFPWRSGVYDFENTVFFDGTPVEAPLADYADPANGLRDDVFYYAGWGSDTLTADEPRPQFIRITLRLEDPRGRLNDGRDVQFVLAVPR